MKALILLGLGIIVTGSLNASAATATSAAAGGEPTVKYKAGKDLNFEQLVIEGQLKRPELSVVTGDADENGNGLLRLRENFVDRMAENAGEDAP